MIILILLIFISTAAFCATPPVIALWSKQENKTRAIWTWSKQNIPDYHAAHISKLREKLRTPDTYEAKKLATSGHSGL